MEATSSGHGGGSYDFSSRGAKVLREFFSSGDGEGPTSSVKDFKDALIELISALEVLSNIVNHATQLCSELGENPRVVQWDQRSLYQIVGKFDKTFEECEEIALMSIKQHMGLDRAHIVDWNPQVLTRVQQLQERMQLHRHKLGIFLRPFETDLLSRLRDRLSTPQPWMKGILLANLEAELDRLRTKPPVTFPDIPADIMAAFDRQAYADEFTFSPLEGCNDFFKYWRLSPLSAHSKPNHPLEPSTKEYISLLKCIWLLRKMQKHFATYSIYPESHWLSFVRALEEDLDIGCRRIGDRLKPPVINVAKLPQSLLFFRPEKESTQLIGTTSREPTMRQVYTGTLESNSRSITRKVQLLRYQSGHRFCIRISETEIMTHGTSREQTETIDINLADAATDLIPLYALPEGNGDKAGFIIRVRLKIARLSFPRINDVLNFQQALTGFKSWDRHCQYNVFVSFVTTGHQEPLVTKACLQLWIPKYLDGELIANSGEPIADYSQSARVQQAADKRRNVVEATEPRVVLFTQDPRSGRLSCITVTLHSDVSVNPERCNCRNGGEAKCAISSLERRKSRLLLPFKKTLDNFDVCVYEGPKESEHIMDWSMNKLIHKEPSSKLSGVKRVSFMFPDAASRAKFSGTPSDCQCDTKATDDIKTNHNIRECLRKGHKGLLGEVQEFERRRQLQLQARMQNKVTDNNDVDWPITSEDDLADSDLPNTSQVGATLTMPEPHSAIPSVVDHPQALYERGDTSIDPSHEPEDRSYRRRRPASDIGEPVETGDLASAHIKRRNAAFISHLSSLIGQPHLPNQGWSQVIVAIQIGVVLGKKLLALVQLVWDHDPTTHVILMEQSTCFMQAIAGLERIIQNDPFGSLTKEEDILVAQRNFESSNVLIVATNCLREAGAYVAKMRQTIESVGDFEVTSENVIKLDAVARGETLGMTNPNLMSGGLTWTQLPWPLPDSNVESELGKDHASDDLSTNLQSAAEVQSTDIQRTESPAAKDLVEVDLFDDSGLPHASDAPPAVDFLGQRRVESHDSQDVTEEQARRLLTTYHVVRIEKQDTHNQFDNLGNQVKQTWQAAVHHHLPAVSQHEAAQIVRRLNQKEGNVRERKHELVEPIQRQLEKAQQSLEKRERDQRYQYTLAQFETKIIESFLEHNRSGSRSKIRSKSKIKSKSMPKQKSRHTVSLTAYFMRTPRYNMSCLKMLQQRDLADEEAIEDEEGGADDEYEDEGSAMGMSPMQNHAFDSYMNATVPASDVKPTATEDEDLGSSSDIEQSSTLPNSTATPIHRSELIVRAVDLLESVMFTLKYIPGDEEHTRIDEVMVDNCYKQMSAASGLVETMLNAQSYGRADRGDRLNEAGFDARDQATSLIRNAHEHLEHAMSRHVKADQVMFYTDRRLTRNWLDDIIDALTITIHQLRQASAPIAPEVELGSGAFSGFMGTQPVPSTQNDSEIDRQIAAAQGLMLSGRLGRAIMVLKDVVEKPRSSSLGRSTSHMKAYLQLSVALRQAGDVEGAISQLVYVDEVMGMRAASDDQLLLDSRVELAKLYMSTGRYNSATAPLLRNIANESFQFDRDSVYQLAAVNMLAIAFRANQQPDRACQVLGLDSATISSLTSISPADVAEESLAGASSRGDSGYGSLEHSSVSAKTAQVTSAQGEAGTYDNETLYSVESVTPKSRNAYIDEFSHRLADDIRQLSISLHPSEPSYPENLPLLLKSFARRLHAESISRSEREVSVFLHKYRGTIVESLGLIPIEDPFEQEDGDENFEEDFEEDERSEMDISLPFKKPESDVNDWVTALEAEMSAHTEVLPLEDQVANTAAADGPPAVDEYQTFVKQSEAYNWLLATIKGSWRLTTPGSSTAMSDIGELIASHFLSQLSARKVSRRTAPVAIETKISLEWDLRRFIEEQQYGVPSAEVLDRAMCLTGTWREAQATTAAEYLKEVWPLTWEPLYALVKAFLASNSGNMCKNETANGSFLCCEQLDSTFVLTIRGKLDFVLETAEQLAWLSSALRTSLVSDGVITCTPSISVIGTSTEGMANKIDAIPSASFHMQFHQDNSTALDDTESLSTGFCWSNLFRNPTIVSGYPILHRTKSNTGLDISVACMAKLIDSEQIFQLAGRIMLKGFCSMLVATEVAKDVVMWHLLYNASGERISFCDERLDAFDLSKTKDVSLGALESRRHILGWCGSIREYTGHPHANREILPSSLPGPAKSFVIERIYAEGGSNLIGGLTVAVGIRDKPVYLPRAKSYSGLLDWVAAQPIIFYDIDDRRAWLIDGASALLHLVRASIDQDRKKPAYRSKWKFDGSLDGDTVYGGGTIAAIETLSNIANLNRSLYLDDIRPLSNGQVEEVHYYFRDRVQETLHYLQVLIDYQAQVAAQDGYWFRQSGKILTKSVIGFDFWDIAKPPGPIRPRAYHLRTGGHGWIEYIRTIRATTIFGRKFGELLQAQNQRSLCPDWRSVPLGMDYLGVSVATLKAIHEARNEAMMNHGEITSDIVWSSKVELFSQCGCVSPVLPSSKHLHVDPVQLLLPKGQKIHLQVPKVHGNVTLGKLGDEGAVLFGHTPYRIGVRPPRDGVSSLVVTPEDDDAEKSIGSAAMSSVSTASDSTARATATTKSSTSQLTNMTSVFSRQSSQQTLSGSIHSSAVDRQKGSKAGDGMEKEKEEPKKSLFTRLGLGKVKK